MTRSRELAELATAYDTGGLSSFKNRIINGDMRIDQRNVGASVTVNANGFFFVADRFAFIGQNSDGVFTAQQLSSGSPVGFSNYMRATVTTADSSLGADQFYNLIQNTEGFNVADFGLGSASAQTCTLSFWVRSSLTGTFGGSLRNSALNRAYPFTYTINSANTWEYKTITIVGDTSGTWLTNNGIGLRISWSLGAGANRKAAAGSWQASNVTGANGETAWISTMGATWDITGVQLEKGSTATSFDYRPYGTELALCQRYYYQMITGEQQAICNIMYYSASAIYGIVSFPVAMRTAPSLSSNSGTNYYMVERGSASDFLDSLFLLKGGSTTTCGLGNNTEASGTIGYAGWVVSNNASTRLGFSAEL